MSTPDVYEPVYFSTYVAGYAGGLQMADSLIIAEQFELIGAGGSPLDPHGTPSVDPALQGAVFRVSNPADAYASGLGGVFSESGFDLGAPQPTTDIVGSLLLDGERPFGYRASNRTIVLPIIIKAPNFQALIAAREALLREVDQQTWTLRWTRDTQGQYAGNTTPLPLLFDCFRAQPTIVSWGAFYNKIPYGILVLTFPALPYGRTDLPVTVDFPTPLAGRVAPPSPLAIDSYSSVTGNNQWSASAQSPVVGGDSAYWDPSASPADNPSGATATPPTGVLNSNPYFPGGSTAGWTFSNAMIAGTVSPPAGAPYPDAIEVTVTTAGGAAESNEPGGKFTVSPGQSFLISGWVYSSVASVAIGVDWQTPASVYLTTTVLTATVTPSTWTFLQTVVTAGPTAGYAYLRLGSPTNGAVIYGQALMARAALGATFTRGQLNLNLAAGWSNGCQGSALTANYFIETAAAAASSVAPKVGDQFQIFASGAPVQSQIFTVTSVSQPSSGYVNVFYTPNSAAATTSSDTAVQTGLPLLPGVTFWAGFGSSNYYTYWARLGGRVVFSLTLTDAYGNTITQTKTVKVTASNQSGAPKWTKVRMTLSSSTTFDYQNVAGYSLTVTNRGSSDLRFTQLYLSALTAVPPPTPIGPTPQRGVVYDLAGLAGAARAPVSLQFQQGGTQTYTRQFVNPGVWQWLCPPGVTTVSVYNIGGGGGGAAFQTDGGGGGSGGSSAANASVAVTPGNLYTIQVGFGGVSGSYNPTSSLFIGDSVTVTAPPGNNATGQSGATAPSAGAGGYAGGAGGAGVASSSGGGGGGGASGGSAAAGTTGHAASGGTGGAFAAAVTNGGEGGRGGTFGSGNGVRGTGYGGGSGGSPGRASGYYYAGSSGLVQLTYTTTTPTFQTLLAHRPPVTAPDMLCPFVSPSVQDTPDGTTQYPVPSLVPGVNARFGGTYTVVASVWAWDTPGSSRMITVTVTQWEQANGASYSSSVSATVTPNTLPVCSDTNAGYGPLVVIGELTLPLQDLPPDNTDCYFTVSITDTDTSDSFMDILFLDTMGSSVIIQSPTGYVNYYLDEAPSDRDLGLVGGSLYDRADAISILDRATIAGGPMSVDPNGNPSLLCYSAEGAPNCELTYFPRWYLDRIQ
jgi:hypothetical protein